MKRIRIFLKSGSETIRNDIPKWWTLDYIHDFLEREYKNRWVDWEFLNN